MTVTPLTVPPAHDSEHDMNITTERSVYNAHVSPLRLARSGQCGIPQLYTDGRGASERHRHAEQYQVGKEHTQNMESKHSHLRTRTTRLVRRTLCCSKTEHRHDLVLGRFINRDAWDDPCDLASTPVRLLPSCMRSILDRVTDDVSMETGAL